MCGDSQPGGHVQASPDSLPRSQPDGFCNSIVASPSNITYREGEAFQCLDINASTKHRKGEGLRTSSAYASLLFTAVASSASALS